MIPQTRVIQALLCTLYLPRLSLFPLPLLSPAPSSNTFVLCQFPVDNRIEKAVLRLYDEHFKVLLIKYQ